MKKSFIVLALLACLVPGLTYFTHVIEARSAASSRLLAQGGNTVAINDASMAEGDTGTSNMIFTVTLTAPGAHPFIGVAYATADGPPSTGATAPSDYTTTSGLLVFPSGTGNATMTISVPIIGDTSIEPDETFFVNITIVDSPATVTDGQGVGTIINDDGTCSYSILPTSMLFEKEGGFGAVHVTAPTGCNWTVVSNDPWITVTSGASGSGDGTVNYSVAANTGDVRTGTITIAGQTFTVVQRTCILDFMPHSQNFPASGGMGSVAVTAASDCNWTAVSQESWITITSGATGSGNGTITYSVAPHMGAVRQGRILIGGIFFSVIQEGVENCAFSISPAEQTVPHDPRSSNTEGRVTITGPEGCIWTARSNDSWIRITSIDTGVGNSILTYRAEENTGPARTGTITIAGQTFTLHQERCPLRLEPTRMEFSFIEQSGSVSAIGDCPITAVSNADWITITSIRFGEVTYRVAENPGAFRKGTITIGDVEFEVVQFSQGSCTIFIDSASDTFFASGWNITFARVGLIFVTAPPGCNWAPRSKADWITTGGTGSGNGAIQYSVAPNTTGRPRFGTIEIRDESLAIQHTFTVNQRAALPPCVQAISPQTINIKADISFVGIAVQVTAPPDCLWDSIAHAGWIEGAAMTGSGNGQISYFVNGNRGGVRSSIIDIGGKIHTVTQNSVDCPVEIICQLFPSQCDEQESQARSFRDKVLARSPRGQRYKQLYYKFSTEAVGLMMLNPSLILRSLDILERYKPVVEAMVKGEQVTLSRGDLEEIDSFLNTFAERGSLQLRETLEGLREDLRDGQVHSEFNIIVTEGPMRESPAHGIRQMGLMLTPLGLFLFCLGLKAARLKVARTAMRHLVCVAVSVTVAGYPLPEMSSRIGTIPSTKMQNDNPPQGSGIFDHLPLRFEANQGQVDPQVRFFSRGNRYNLFLTATEAVLTLATRRRGDAETQGQIAASPPRRVPASNSVMRMKMVGANPDPKIKGLDEMPGRANYFIGSDSSKWRSSAPTYGRVKYDNVYRGIDLVYYGNQGEMEYDFIVAPGADPGQIGLGFEGADGVEIDQQGDLVMRAGSGEVRQPKPVAWQEVGGKRREIDCRFAIHNQVAGFELGDYDARLPLVIDPVLAYSTYFGGSGTDEGSSIAVDQAGNVYVTGLTSSINFPTSGSQASFGGGQQDAFVFKLDPSGTRVIYSTYLGGNGQDNGTGIAVDSSGNAYITGFTSSTNFPVRNALQQTSSGDFDAFVVKLSPTGSIINSTLMGGSQGDFGSSIAVDSAGNIYVAGIATSINFPMANALQSVFGGATDVYVAKIAPTGDRLLFSTYLGGTGIEGASSIAVDSAGNIYLTGLTSSPEFGTVRPLQASHGGGLFDAFVAKLNPSGNEIIYSTFLGGRGEDRAFRIAVDLAGNAYVTGDTDSTDFPVSNAAQQSNRGSADAFAAKISPSGDLLFSTYLGGSGLDGGTAIAVDSAGSVYVTGFTTSTDFPTVNPLQQNFRGRFDGFIAKLKSSGAALDYSTYFGGSGIDSLFGVAAGEAGVSVMGLTDSTDFPLSNPLQPSNAGGTSDLFIASIKSDPVITDAMVDGRKLLVLGSGFDSGAKILINGQAQKTAADSQNPTGALIGAKAGRKIKRGQTATLQVRNSDGALSNEFVFSRP